MKSPNPYLQEACAALAKPAEYSQQGQEASLRLEAEALKRRYEAICEGFDRSVRDLGEKVRSSEAVSDLIWGKITRAYS